MDIDDLLYFALPDQDIDLSYLDQDIDWSVIDLGLPDV